MAYNTEELFNKGMEAIEKHKLFFIEDIIAFLPCRKSTFYEHFSNETDYYKRMFEALEKNRTTLKVSMRSKWYTSNAPALQMAFDDYLPKYSESRCIAISIKLIKKNAPQIKWVISFADGTQCGDGTIYRASGFELTGIKENSQLAINPINNKVEHKITAFHNGNEYDFKNWEKVKGFQFRYIYLIDKTCKITVPILPFSEIEKRGAGMYKGIKKISDNSITANAANFQLAEGGQHHLIAQKTTK